jgi:DNA-binding response OmpR family regulator
LADRQPLVALVERGAAMAEFLDAQLALDGMATIRTQSAPDALATCGAARPTLLLVGDLSRRRDVLDLIATVRAGYVAGVDRLLPIVHITARTGELDVLRVFEAGADDVIAKPFSYPLLHARLEALLRRATASRDDYQMAVAGLEIDSTARRVRVDGATVALSPLEHALLVRLASAPRCVFSKRELLRDVWGFRSATMTRAVDAAAARLRRKLGPGWVVNVWGVGYRLVDPESRDATELDSANATGV